MRLPLLFLPASQGSQGLTRRLGLPEPSGTIAWTCPTLWSRRRLLRRMEVRSQTFAMRRTKTLTTNLLSDACTVAPSFEQQQQQATLRHSRSLSRAQPPAHHFDSLRALGQPVGRIGSEDDHDFWSGLPRGFSAVQQQQQVGGGGGEWDARKPKRIITNGGASSSQGRDEVSVLVDNMVRDLLSSMPCAKELMR